MPLLAPRLFQVRRLALRSLWEPHVRQQGCVHKQALPRAFHSHRWHREFGCWGVFLGIIFIEGGATGSDCSRGRSHELCASGVVQRLREATDRVLQTIRLGLPVVRQPQLGEEAGPRTLPHSFSAVASRFLFMYWCSTLEGHRSLSQVTQQGSSSVLFSIFERACKHAR